MATEFAALGRTVLQLADTIQHFGNNYYKAKRAWKIFPGQVILLRANHVYLDALLEKYWCPVDKSFFGALEKAKELMTNEVARLDDISRRTLRVSEILFPEQVGNAIQDTVKAYDGIIEHLKSRLKVEQALEETGKRAPLGLPFGEDSQNRYVRLESEDRINFALRKSGEDSPNVVLLYGGRGKGKSTVARQVSLNHAKDNSTFTRVFVLECGSDMNAQAKQMELLQQLGNDDLSEISGLEGTVSPKRLQKRLQNLLRQQRLLIVLDDLCKPGFLQELLNLSGRGVKYLVTSPKNVCKDLNCRLESFKVDELQHDGARKVLAIHAGFPSQEIPEDLQKVAEKILNIGEGVPLILATLGAQIAKGGNPHDPRMWRSVSENYLECLSRDKPSASIQGQEYASTYWSALKQSIDDLSPEQKNLLLLMSACRGPSVSQELLQFFSNITVSNEKSKGLQFYHLEQMKTELKSMELVLEKNKEQLSLHSLTKDLIVKHMRETIDSVVSGDLLGELGGHFEPNVPGTRAEKNRVIRVLVCLYLDARFTQQADPPIGHHYHDTFSDEKRTAVEPITQLLVREANSSKSEFQTSAAQVLLKFICNNALDYEHVSRLLMRPTITSVMSTMEFLQNVSLLGESFWQGGGSFWQGDAIQAITSTLFWLFQNSTDVDFQFQVAKTLIGLCTARDCPTGNVSTTGLLQQLVDCLSQVQNPKIQSAATAVLASIGYLAGPDSMPSIVTFPGLLHILVEALANPQNPDVLFGAASALRSLTAAAVRTTIEETNVNLSESCDDGTISAQVYDRIGGVVATQNQAAPIDTVILRKIANCPNLVENLAALLTEDKNLRLQAVAARALGNLGCKDQENKQKLVNVPGLLDHLVKLLHQSPDLPACAALALRNLATSDDLDTRHKIGSCSNLIEGLAASLVKDDSLYLQENAIGALASLVYKDQAIAKKVANIPGLLDHLVKS